MTEDQRTLRGIILNIFKEYEDEDGGPYTAEEA
jgi:hypothetical protein